MCPPDDSVGGVAGETPNPQLTKSNRGRKPGIPNTHSTKAVKRLAELGFDPIEEMVKKYQEIGSKIKELESKERPPNGVISDLLATQQKITNDLMRYGYARTPEVNTQQVINDTPMVILSTTPENYEKLKEEPIDELPMKGDHEDDDLT